MTLQAQSSLPSGSDLLQRYRKRGLWCGLALGAMGGVLVCGPHVHDWPLAASGTLVLGFSAGLGLLGWLFAPLAIGAVGGAGVPITAEQDGHADGDQQAGQGGDAD